MNYNRPLPSSKNPHFQGLVHNLSYEDEFYLHENEKSFSYQRLSTYSRFETEAGGTRKWPYFATRNEY